MKRKIEARLHDWKERGDGKPLVLLGARQVGKTYSVKQFGASEFRRVAYIDFQLDGPRFAPLFEPDLNPQRIVANIQALLGMPIDPSDTLVVFDEIQLCQPALTALKYFSEQLPTQRVIATGSQFGVTVKRNPQYSFPVGKVHILDMFPLDFEEFLWAHGRESWAGLIREQLTAGNPLVIHEDLLRLYRQYVMTGGMPAAVTELITTGSFQAIRDIQAELTRLYVSDMNLYLDSADAARAVRVWDTAPRQLTRETGNKFKFADAERGGRAKNFDMPFAWLEAAGLIHRQYQTEQPHAPLIPRDGGSFFKVFLADVGLTARAVGIRPDIFFDPISAEAISPAARGALAETFVKQQLVAIGVNSMYWASGNMAEVDFLIVDPSMRVIPVEVKSSDRVRAKSLKVYTEKYNPPYAIRLTAKNFGYEDKLRAIPIYAAFCLDDLSAVETD